MTRPLTFEAVEDAVRALSALPGADVSGADIEDELRRKGYQVEQWVLADAARQLRASRRIDFVNSGGSFDGWGYFRVPR
jgi:hypothetical protein